MNASDAPSCVQGLKAYGRSPQAGNPIASILKSNVYGIPALAVLNPVSNLFGVYHSVRKISLSSSTPSMLLRRSLAVCFGGDAQQDL